jgi:hypothetical protein
MASRKRKGPLDVLRSNVTGANEDAAHDLFLYADNTSELYPRKKAILVNLLRKILKGTYNPALAPKAFEYLMADAAKRYVREIGVYVRAGQKSTFSAPTRRLAAKMMAEQEDYSLTHGGYTLAALTR